jgi:hypothetical protein
MIFTLEFRTQLDDERRRRLEELLEWLRLESVFSPVLHRMLVDGQTLTSADIDRLLAASTDTRPRGTR